MPAVASLSEFNRNQTEVIAKLQETKEPLYLTRNGSSAVVVMDAEAFDKKIAAKDELYEREMEIYAGLMRGYKDVLDGNIEDASEAFADIRAQKGWN